MPGESAAAFKALVSYVGMPKRSLRLLADMTMTSPDTLKEWSSKYEWARRILEYETNLANASLARQAEIKDRKAMRAELIDQIGTKLITTFFQSGMVAVQNELITNPAGVGINKALSMASEARKLFKAISEEMDRDDDLEAAESERADSVLDSLEAEIEREKNSPPAENPLPPVPPQTDNPGKGS